MGETDTRLFKLVSSSLPMAIRIGSLLLGVFFMRGVVMTASENRDLFKLKASSLVNNDDPSRDASGDEKVLRKSVSGGVIPRISSLLMLDVSRSSIRSLGGVSNMDFLALNRQADAKSSSSSSEDLMVGWGDRLG